MCGRTNQRNMTKQTAAMLVISAGMGGVLGLPGWVLADAGSVKPVAAAVQPEQPVKAKTPVYREPGAPVAGGAELVSGPVMGAPAPVVSEAPGIAAARERVKAQRAAAAAATAAKQQAAKAEVKAPVGTLTGAPPMRDPMAASPAKGPSGVAGQGGAKLVVKDAKQGAAGVSIDEQRLMTLAKWIDADGSGAIEPAEWRALHPGLGDFDREFEQRYLRANGSLRARALMDWDSDSDGEVSDAELEVARKHWERSRLLIVSGFDKDGDAKLDLLELRAFEGSLGGVRADALRVARAGGAGTGGVPSVAAGVGVNGESGPRLSQYRITTTRVATIVSTLDQE